MTVPTSSVDNRLGHEHALERMLRSDMCCGESVHGSEFVGVAGVV